MKQTVPEIVLLLLLLLGLAKLGLGLGREAQTARTPPVVAPPSELKLVTLFCSSNILGE